MVVELINTGTELLLGRVLNTHQQWLGLRLAEMGYVVDRQVTVPDTGPAIQEAVRDALGRADLVVTTGGLGPTSDDRTRDCIAEVLQRPLREDPAMLAHIRSFFEQRKRVMPERTRLQALVPEGAVVLPNAYGTAPGLAMQATPGHSGSNRAPWVIMLPGPPRELRPMFQDAVVPLLRRVLPAQDDFVCRTLRTTGIGESLVEEAVAPSLASLVGQGLELGYCARPGEVDVRLAARGPHAQAVVAQAEAVVNRHVGKWLFATGEEELEQTVIRLLTRRQETLALAESCTGGCLAHRLTNVPGASAVLLAGIVSYSNAAKQNLLGVRAETLAAHGAVSEAVAREMALGAREKTAATYALSVTGIAGPSGGTATKPVGTVFIGLATRSTVVVQRHLNPWDRHTFKQVAAQQAMNLLRQTVLAEPAV